MRTSAMGDGTLTQSALFCDIPDVPKRICSVEGCERELRYHAAGLCNMHYRRTLRSMPLGGADSLVAPKGTWTGKDCEMPGCTSKARRRGYCKKHHFQRIQEDGLLDDARRVAAPYRGRECSIGGCEKSAMALGYCSMHYDRRRSGTHRLAEPAPIYTRKGASPGCSVPGCE